MYLISFLPDIFTCMSVTLTVSFHFRRLCLVVYSPESSFRIFFPLFPSYENFWNIFHDYSIFLNNEFHSSCVTYYCFCCCIGLCHVNSIVFGLNKFSVHEFELILCHFFFKKIFEELVVPSRTFQLYFHVFSQLSNNARFLL